MKCRATAAACISTFFEQAVAFQAPDGRVYGVNGLALSTWKLPPIREIQILGKDTMPLLKRGWALCGVREGAAR